MLFFTTINVIIYMKIKFIRGIHTKRLKFNNVDFILEKQLKYIHIA